MCLIRVTEYGLNQYATIYIHVTVMKFQIPTYFSCIFTRVV